MSTIALRGLRTASLSARIYKQPNFSLRRDYKSQFLLPAAYTQSLRFASTTTTAIKTPPTPKPSPLNGPPSTLPAPLDLPTRGKDQALPIYLLALGKAYVTFYKTGVKNIYHNFQLTRALNARLAKTPIPQAIKSKALTRADFQLLARNTHDMRRAPIFALVLLVCGEFTPLIVLALSGAVPWTCRIPKQIDSSRAGLEARRKISFRNLTIVPSEKAKVEELGRMELLHINWSLGLSSKWWDYLGGQLPGLPTGILRRRVIERLTYLGRDDTLIQMYGGVKEMDAEEVKIACVERGIDVVERDVGDIRGDLAKWMKSREKVPAERLLCMRPNSWPVQSHHSAQPIHLNRKESTRHNKKISL